MGGAIAFYHFNVDIIMSLLHIGRAKARDPTLLPALTNPDRKEIEMANMSTTTPSGVTEYFYHSHVSLRFSRLIVTLASAIEAERDIEHGLWCDPAFADLLRHAEINWETVNKACLFVLDAPLTRVSDVPLQKMADHLHYTLGCETVVELRCAQSTMRAHPDFYSFSGTCPISQRVASMLDRARQQFSEICSLEMLTSNQEAEYSLNVPQASVEMTLDA